MVYSLYMEDVLPSGWDKRIDACTKYNILQAFDKELHGVRITNKVSTNNILVSTAIINLPFKVDQEMTMCQPNLEYSTWSVNLFIVVKRVLTVADHNQSTIIQVRVSRAPGNTNNNKKKVSLNYVEHSGSSDSDEIATSTKALFLQKFACNKNNIINKP
jgi:hypothetical protein